MELEMLLKGIGQYRLEGEIDREVSGIAYDSRKAASGSLFVAIKGNSQDGHDYLENAVQRGAEVLVGQAFEGIGNRVTKITVPDSRKVLSDLAIQFYGRPFEGINLIGITGTNGKTTTSYIIESIIQHSGGMPGVIGTINYRFGGENYPALVTTPESLDLMGIFREMADRKVSDIIMEVSSHALDQKRTAGCSFRIAVFTNLSRDHLDYHGDMESYFQAKSLMFRGLKQGRDGRVPCAVINIDDPRGRDLVKISDCEVITYGLAGEADIRAVDMQSDLQGIKATLLTSAGEMEIDSSFIGGFNIYNIMASVGTALSLGISIDSIKAGINGIKNVPGRLEQVENRKGLKIVVDYSHTPDALLKAVTALRPLVRGRLVTVFGCGGDRDRGKRPLMGKAAVENSDIAIVTSDNPRTEDPLSIIREIEKGVLETGASELKGHDHKENHIKGYLIESDRRQAIKKAVNMAGPEDLVLIAGKGHEDYQIIGTQKQHFDDREEAALAASGESDDR